MEKEKRAQTAGGGSLGKRCGAAEGRMCRCAGATGIPNGTSYAYTSGGIAVEDLRVSS